MSAQVEESAAGPKRASSSRPASRAPWVVVGLALVLVGLGAILLSSAFDKPHESRPLYPNLPVDDAATDALDLRAINSPGLVRSPVEAGNLAVASRVDSPDYSCTLNVSFDGGGRWTQTAIPAPATTKAGTKCYAPDATFASDGTLYLTFVTLKGRANAPEAAWIARSRDGGKTLSQPMRTPLPRHSFQVRLTADARRPGRLYLTYLRAEGLGLYKFTKTGNPIEAIRSDDGGNTWSDPARVSSASRQRALAPSPVAGPEEGELYVLFLDVGEDTLDYAGGHGGQGGPPYQGKWQLVLARSTDRGGTWKESVIDAGIVPTERFIAFTPPFPSVAVAESGDVYAAFHDGRDGDGDVRLWKLPAGASEWTAPVRVNDTPKGDGTEQYLPKVGIAPDGRVDVLYYDRRSDKTNVLNEVSLQSSFDGGESFGSRVRVSDKAFSSRIGFGLERNLADLGSRLGLISTNRRAYGVWTDTRAGSLKTAKQDIARGIVAFNDPARLSGGVKTLLRVGGGALILLGLIVIVLLGRPAHASASRRGS